MNIDTLLAEFHREGIARIPQAIAPDVVQRLRALADRHLDNPEATGCQVESIMGAAVLRNTQSLDPFFSEFVAWDPFLSLSEAILGKDPGFCGQNVIRSGLNEAISVWHVDDVVEFPLPPEVPRHDARVQMPVVWFSVQIALSDIDTLDDGPTEVVPGSHYSGRPPPFREARGDEVPEFEGQVPVPMLCKAGDAYLFNHQLWHRGRPNRSGNIRYLMQNQYSRRWAATRFGPGPHHDCQLPPDAVAGLSAAARRVLRV